MPGQSILVYSIVGVLCGRIITSLEQTPYWSDGMVGLVIGFGAIQLMLLCSTLALAAGSWKAAAKQKACTSPSELAGLQVVYL